jgi:hypothetical protein
MAENLLAEKGVAEDVLETAFRLSVGRTPDAKELSLVKKYHQEEKEKFTENRSDALAYIETGSTKLRNSSDPVQVAALATVINGLMNTTDGYTIR